MTQVARARSSSGDGPARPLTSFAVARAAGVSQSTVSLVMSGKAAGRVSAATQALVETTVRRLGYQPNVSARTLRTGMARTLALAVPNVQQPFFGQLLVAAEHAAREHDYAVILIDTTTDVVWTDRLLGMLRSGLVAGCIVYAGDDKCDQRLLPARERILFVEAEDTRNSSVDLDVGGGMHAVVQHLIGLGHRRIGYFAAGYPKGTYRRRYASFRDELKQHDLPHCPGWRTSATFELEEATLAARTLLAQADISALFCDDDLLAGAAYRTARNLGIVIPAQLSVVGFNDLEMARLLSPELTTVAIPVDAVGRTAVERLLAQLQRPTEMTAAPFVAALELRVRASTAPPGDGDPAK